MGEAEFSASLIFYDKYIFLLLLDIMLKSCYYLVNQIFFKEYTTMSMEQYNQLLQNYVNAPYSTLLAVANDSLSKIMPIFNEVAKDGNGASIVLPFICTALAVDGKFTELEYRFVKDLLGIDQTYDYFKNVVQQFYTTEYINAVDELIDACPDQLKTALLSFCITFVAVDEHISREENAFIAKLMG